MILNTEVRSSPGCLWCEWRTFPRPWGRDSFQALSDAKNLRLKRFAELPSLGIQFCCTPSVLGQVGPGHKEQMHTAYSAPVYLMQIQSDIISQTWLQLKSFWVSIVDIPKFWASLPHFLAEAVSWHPHRGAQGKDVSHDSHDTEIAWVVFVATLLGEKYYEVGQQLMSVETNRLAAGWKEANIMCTVFV